MKRGPTFCKLCFRDQHGVKKSDYGSNIKKFYKIIFKSRQMFLRRIFHYFKFWSPDVVCLKMLAKNKGRMTDSQSLQWLTIEHFVLRLAISWIALLPRQVWLQCVFSNHFSFKAVQIYFPQGVRQSLQQCVGSVLVFLCQ